jgi:hypothetical protein
MKKTLINSNTIQFFLLVFAGGGTDAVIELLRNGTIDWRSVAIMVISIAGIALRVKTTQPIE